MLFVLKSNISECALLISGWKNLNVFYYVIYVILKGLIRTKTFNFPHLYFRRLCLLLCKWGFSESDENLKTFFFFFHFIIGGLECDPI